jgi:hypothetical protein
MFTAFMYSRLVQHIATMDKQEHASTLPSAPPAMPGNSGSMSAEESKPNDAQDATNKQSLHRHHDPTITSHEHDAAAAADTTGIVAREEDGQGSATICAPGSAGAAAEKHDAKNRGALGDVEAKNPFDDDADVSISDGGGAPDTEPGESASIPVHNEAVGMEHEEKAASTWEDTPDVATSSDAAAKTPVPPPLSATSPAQAPPPPQQASPFPKFEPYRPNESAGASNNDATARANDNAANDDEWAAFEDSFQEEDTLEMPRLGVSNAAAGAEPSSAGNAKPSLFPAPEKAESSSSSLAFAPSILTLEDIEICQRLDEEFDRALEERDVAWTARYSSVRQCACLSLTFMAIYLVLGTWYFFRHTDWALSDTLLFSIYTMTTVGFGNHDIPNTAGVQTFIIFFIFVGIATLTIMVAQVYQCVVLETTRAQYSRDKAELSRHRQQSSHLGSPSGGGVAGGVGSRVSSTHGGSMDETWAVDFDSVAESTRSCGERILRDLDRTKHFLRHTELGRGVSVLLPFAGLIFIGAVVVGPIEGWTFIESIYFAVVALTTVGFGDYFPTKKASTWFCIFWLPFSVGFMSLYLGGVAHFYIQLSDSNIQRLERQMRRRIRKAKEWAEKERREASARVEAANATEKRKKIKVLEVESGGDIGGDGDGGDDSRGVKATVSPSRKPKSRDDFFQTLPSGDMTDEDDEDGVSPSVGVMGKQILRAESRGESFGAKRRERIIADASRSEKIQNGGEVLSGGDITDLEDGATRPRGTTMSTMRDIIDTVHGHMSSHGAGATPLSGGTLASIMSGNVQVKIAPETDLISIRSSRKVSHRKPSFALRVLVQERLAEIIAIEVAGYQTRVDIQENTMAITIDRLKAVLDKWFIPRRARKAFRGVAFESLYFVGERGLIIRGADALYDLTPLEFHSLFAPLLAAMDDADTMEGWLENTNVLAEVDLKKNYGLMSTSPVKRLGLSERLAAARERQKHNNGRDAATKVTKATYRRKVPGNALSK